MTLKRSVPARISGEHSSLRDPLQPVVFSPSHVGHHSEYSYLIISSLVKSIEANVFFVGTPQSCQALQAKLTEHERQHVILIQPKNDSFTFRLWLTVRKLQPALSLPVAIVEMIMLAQSIPELAKRVNPSSDFKILYQSADILIPLTFLSPLRIAKYSIFLFRPVSRINSGITHRVKQLVKFFSYAPIFHDPRLAKIFYLKTTDVHPAFLKLLQVKIVPVDDPVLVSPSDKNEPLLETTYNEITSFVNANKGKRLLLCYGHIGPRKNIHLLLDSIFLASWRPPVAIILAGVIENGYASMIKERLRHLTDLGIASLVIDRHITSREEALLFEVADIVPVLNADTHISSGVALKALHYRIIMIVSRDLAKTLRVPSHPNVLTLATMKQDDIMRALKKAVDMDATLPQFNRTEPCLIEVVKWLGPSNA
jgi:hypothetical protein